MKWSKKYNIFGADLKNDSLFTKTFQWNSKHYYLLISYRKAQDCILRRQTDMEWEFKFCLWTDAHFGSEVKLFDITIHGITKSKVQNIAKENVKEKKIMLEKTHLKVTKSKHGFIEWRSKCQ